MRPLKQISAFLALLNFNPSLASSTAQNRTLYNPALPGWHSDPSCVFVAERNNTTFCTSSTFLLTPGLPIHTSQDLVNWKLASHALSRKEQYPEFDQSLSQNDGIWAATIRYHEGTFYIITIYKDNTRALQTGLIFTTEDPYSDDAWSVPVRYTPKYIDPDIFWDEDGTAYVASAGTYLQTVDVKTGNMSEPTSIWNDANGQWWSSALSWRSGPQGTTYPMGREMSLTPVIWNEGDWPIFAPVRGIMNAWYLPPDTSFGPFTHDPDVIDFEPNSTLPAHFGFWRWPQRDSYAISPPGHPGTLRLTPSAMGPATSANNLTRGYDIANMTLAMRVQTDTLFSYNVDISFSPQVLDEETGVTVWLNQVQNLNLGIVMLQSNTTNSRLAPHFRFAVSGLGSSVIDQIPPVAVTPVPSSWLSAPVRLSIRAENEKSYTFYAASTRNLTGSLRLGEAPGSIVSGGMGPFTGSLVGVYATNNHGNGSTPAYVSRWRYQGLGQQVGFTDFVPSGCDF
ncbi:xylosidase : arabinofuranosidase protein [Rutstroemia sp. NJR-2017a BBW]|nr:xylosidase : arabinofuranosidase protein [Rutstroemia sp. NJR-2017a BBW]